MTCQDGRVGDWKTERQILIDLGVFGYDGGQH